MKIAAGHNRLRAEKKKVITMNNFDHTPDASQVTKKFTRQNKNYIQLLNSIPSSDAQAVMTCACSY